MVWNIVLLLYVVGTSLSSHPPNNRRQTECSDINITTSDTNQYTLLSDYGVTIDNSEDLRIEFKIKASHAIEVVLMSTNSIDDPLYKIILGGPGNTIIVMRAGKKGKVKGSYKNPLLSSNEFKTFIVTWKNSIVKVKNGNEKILIAWTDKGNPLRIVNVGIATSGITTGDWVIPCKAFHQNSCEENELTCADGNGCYEPGWKCDGHGDCSDASDEENCVRLPLDMYPSLYHLEIQPHIYNGKYKKFHFDGFVKIEMMCRQSTNKIVLHSNELDITVKSIVIRQMGSTEELIYPTLEYNTYYQLIILTSDVQLTAGETYTVEMSFKGKLTYDLVGPYLSSYRRQRDRTWVYQVATHFQATEARRAFPCFDEPAIKAKFRITLVRKNHMVSLSNTDVIRQEVRSNDWVADHYAETPMMSTYLLAFVICDFEQTADIVNGVTYRSWARKDVANHTQYALNLGVDIMNYYEDYLDVNLPLSKSDMVAVPDFGPEAMGNLGLILYKESSMLFDPEESSESDKQGVAMLVSHALSHQWFGNLVTAKWWSDVWLHEAFATYLEYTGPDHMYPDWNMMDDFVFDILHNGLKWDGMAVRRPVNKEVSFPGEIDGLFDDISYEKGPCIVRMMHFFLGEHTFKRGLQRFLKKYQYSTVTHDDLYNALEKQAKIDGKSKFVQDIKHIVDTWILQSNYPTVTITKEGDDLTLSQSRYIVDHENVDEDNSSPFEYKWVIPVTFTTNSNLRFDQTDKDITWMDRDGSDVVLSGVMSKALSSDWYIGNLMQYGYYRVNYPEENWYNLINQLKTDHTKFTKKIFSRQFRKCNNNTAESHTEKIAKKNIVGMACDNGDEECIEMAKSSFKQFMESQESNPIDVNLRDTVYCTGVRHGGKKEWEFVLRKIKSSSSPPERKVLFRALSCSKDSKLLQRYMKFTINSEEIRQGEFTKALLYLSKNKVGRSLALEYLTENSDVVDRLAKDGIKPDKIFPELIETFTSDHEVEGVKYLIIQHTSCSYL
ncbi:ANPEP [Mytilus edulis]|uniref:ANPEP n=1 Tax=Mytilus edulis TaxID=6550 RepID=A0A8S3TK79_MYTED|nr:ANPEP [Mytilus edulis]